MATADNATGGHVTYTPTTPTSILPVGQINPQAWGVDPSSFGVVNVRPGYDVVESAKHPIRPGGMISQLQAKYLADLNTENINSQSASLAAARQHQLMQSQNDPATYQTAQAIMRATGMSADKALHVAMTQQLASNGNFLGLGASLPATQQAVNDINNRDFELANLFGLPQWNSQSTGGAFNVGSSGFTGYNSKDGKTSLVYGNKVVNGLDGNELLAAATGVRSGDYNSLLNQAANAALGTATPGSKVSTKTSTQTQTQPKTQTPTQAQISQAVARAVSSYNQSTKASDKATKEAEKAAAKAAEKAAKQKPVQLYGL